VSVEDWAKGKGIYEGFSKDFIEFLVAATVGRLPHEVGVHYLFDYIKSAGGWDNVAAEGESGAQSLKIKQGMSSIGRQSCPGDKKTKSEENSRENT
jgi:monoamine oxidase